MKLYYKHNTAKTVGSEHGIRWGVRAKMRDQEKREHGRLGALLSPSVTLNRADILSLLHRCYET